jgi:hypothetical protein
MPALHFPAPAVSMSTEGPDGPVAHTRGNPMKRAIALTVVALTAACGGKPITPEEARGALPQAEQAQVVLPAGAASAFTAARSGEAIAAATSASYAHTSFALAHAVNGGVGATLLLVRLVSLLPPTSCEGDTCTWGPGSDATDLNDWRLTVSKRDGHYEWALAGLPKNNQGIGFVTVISGDAFPTGQPLVGHGNLLADFDASAKLSHWSDDALPQGKIAAQYDTRSGRQVSVQFVGMKDDVVPTQTVNAAYAYQATSAGGELQVATHNLDTTVELTLHTRWTGTGAGRGDASYTAPLATYTQSQCWDGATTTPAFSLTYQLSSPAQLSDTGGDPALLCAFPSAQPPSIVMP